MLPSERLEDYLKIAAAIKTSAHELKLPVRLQKYEPPRDPHFKLAPGRRRFGQYPPHRDLYPQALFAGQPNSCPISSGRTSCRCSRIGRSRATTSIPCGWKLNQNSTSPKMDALNTTASAFYCAKLWSRATSQVRGHFSFVIILSYFFSWINYS